MPQNVDSGTVCSKFFGYRLFLFRLMKGQFLLEDFQVEEREGFERREGRVVSKYKVK